jgi:hypothetical protein
LIAPDDPVFALAP